MNESISKKRTTVNISLKAKALQKVLPLLLPVLMEARNILSLVIS